MVRDYTSTLKEYGCNSVTGDRYAGQWVVEAFRSNGITYKHSEQTKSDLYLESEPLFARGAIRLLDSRILLAELQQLERRTRSGGRDSIDHGPGGHDDYANVATGACVLAIQQQKITGRCSKLTGY